VAPAKMRSLEVSQGLTPSEALFLAYECAVVVPPDLAAPTGDGPCSSGAVDVAVEQTEMDDVE
jgi:hypothetical protein